MNASPMPFECFSKTPACAPGECGWKNGWALPYAKRPSPPTWHAVAFLYVIDLSDVAKLFGPLPFVIDTGSPITMIPRGLLRDRSVFRRRPFDVFKVRDVSGDVIAGQRFLTALSLNPTMHSECGALAFEPIQVFVPDLDPDPGGRQLGLLGLDALRQKITIFEPSRVVFQDPA